MSTANVDPNLVESTLSEQAASIGPIQKGVGAVFLLPVGDSEINFLAQISPGDVRFELIDSAQVLKLRSIVDIFKKNFTVATLRKTLPDPLANIVDTILDVQLANFKYENQPERMFSAQLRLDGDHVLLQRPFTITIKDVVADLSLVLTSPVKATFAVSGQLLIGTNNTFIVEVQPPQSGSGFVINAHAERIEIGKLAKEFAAQFLPKLVSTVLEKLGFDKFVIAQPRLLIPLTSEEIGIKVSGTFEFGSFGGATVAGEIIRKDGETSFLVGIDFSNFKFTRLLGLLLPFSINLDFLDQSVQCAVVFSKVQRENPELPGPALSRLKKINPGLTIVAYIGIPESCNNDFCKFLREKLGNPSLFIFANIENFQQITLKAGIQDLQIQPGFVLSEVALEVGLGANNYFQLSASLTIERFDITFTAALRLGQSGIQITLDLEGNWVRPFGFPFLTIHRLHASIAFSPPLGGLELGGEVSFGYPPTPPNAIRVGLFVGIHTSDPNFNYFYFKINKLTLTALMKAFGFSVNIPRIIGESGFPEGLTVSYALQNHDVAGLRIPEGFYLRGRLNILGYTIYAELQVSTTRVKIDARMDRIQIGGQLLEIYRSRTDQQSGPFLYLDVQLGAPPKVKTNISGYCSMLYGKIKAEIVVEIDATHFKFFIAGELFFLNVNLFVYANYGSFAGANFQARGQVNTEQLEQIVAETIKRIQDGTKDAQSKLLNARNSLESTKRAVSDAQAKAKQKEKVFRDAENHLESKKANLRKVVDDVNARCRAKDCQQRCHGWKCKFVSWVKRSICTVRNGACYLGKHAVATGIKAAEGLVDAAKAVVNVARLAYNQAVKALDLANLALTAAQRVLDGLRKTLGEVGRIAEAVIEFTTKKIFRLYYLNFDLAISVLNQGYFKANVSLSVLSHDFKGSIDVKIDSLKNLALSLWEKVKGLFKKRRRRDYDEPIDVDIVALARQAIAARERKRRSRVNPVEISHLYRKGIELIQMKIKEQAEKIQNLKNKATYIDSLIIPNSQTGACKIYSTLSKLLGRVENRLNEASQVHESVVNLYVKQMGEKIELQKIGMAVKSHHVYKSAEEHYLTFLSKLRKAVQDNEKLEIHAILRPLDWWIRHKSGSDLKHFVKKIVSLLSPKVGYAAKETLGKLEESLSKLLSSKLGRSSKTYSDVKLYVKVLGEKLKEKRCGAT